MNTLVRFVSAAAVLGTALMLSGCVSTTAKAPRAQVVEEFAVVESSTEKELTPGQLAELRQAVLNYLHEQGMTNSRIYYVKVNFEAEKPGEVPQWAIVRIGNVQNRTYTVLAAYPGPDDYYPYDYYRTGYYPGYSYSGFSRWGYYDPFDYNYGGYTGRTGHPRDHTKPDHTPNHPPGTRTRWDNHPRTEPDQPRGDYPPRTANPERWGRDRSNNPGGTPGRPHTPPPERSYTPPPERSSTPPPQSEPPSSGRVESSNAGIQQAASGEKEK